MKSIAFLGWLLLSSHACFCQTSGPEGQFQQDSTYLATHYRRVTVHIPMRDHVSLYGVIYVPLDATRRKAYPILMTRTPYNAEGQAKGIDRSESFMKLVKDGYIFVIEDVRGRWHSEGVFVHERPRADVENANSISTDESTDAYDTIEWLLANIEGNNGRVGVYGVSYAGFYTIAALLSRHPAIKAVSPQAPVTDWFTGDDIHHNGAFFWLDLFTFLPTFENDDPDQKTLRSFGVLPFQESDGYDYFLHRVQTPRLANSLYFKDSIPFWNDVCRHPDNDDYWKSRNLLRYWRNMHVPMLIVGGWFDAEDLYGTLETYRKGMQQNPGEEIKLAMGPWNHGGWRSSGEDFNDVEFGSRTGDVYIDSLFRPFMDAHLKRGGEDHLPSIVMFETGTNKWRTFRHWPPAGDKQLSLYLQPEGKASFDEPGPASSCSGYTSDPSNPVPYQNRKGFYRSAKYMNDDQHFAAVRKDVLSFQTDTLQSDITIGGPMVADLWASLTTTDADFVVKLIDVSPRDNSQRLVRAQIMRGRYRNSLERPEAFEPGKITSVRYDLPDVLHTFLKGHRMMIQVQSSWFPLVDRNPQQFINIYKAMPEDYILSDIRIYHDKSHPSRLIMTAVN